MSSRYHFRRALVLRFMGAALVMLGLALLGLSAVVLVLDLPLAILTVALLAVVALVVGGGWVLVRLAPLVRLDDVGYRVRLLRGAGVNQARWRDVEDVITARVAGQDCVVLRLRNGGTTTIPVAVLDGGRDRLVADLRGHLDRAHGYRRLR